MESVCALSELAHVEAFEIPQEHHRGRFVWDHLRSLLSGRAYTDFMYESAPFGRRLAQTLRDQHFDLVHVDSLDLAAYLPVIGASPIVCVHHNVESVLLRRRAMTERSPWMRRYLMYQARLVERLEQRWCDRVALNVVVSPDDADVLSRIAPSAQIAVVPNGVDTEYFQPRHGSEEGVVCVGGVNGFANRDALDELCQNILPVLRDFGLSIPVRWVGRASESDRAAYRERYGVELTGYVDDVRPFVERAACYAVPLRVGGGTRVKILDAWAMGKAVVSTSIGCEGLEAIDGQNILIRDTPREFAQAVRAVIEDAALRQRLGAAARCTAERLYGWDVIGEPLLSTYRALARSHPTAEQYSRC
jgi:glycosyltransferase involved in cell wall biosynthesis